MQKAPVMKGSGLQPLDDSKNNQEVHVFGRNLEDRVLTSDQEESTSMSFASFQKDNHTTPEEDIESFRKRKFDAITGEEDEETAFQGEFKLYVWDLATSNWIEKGRGQLKLNDSVDEKEKKSRLIMRVSGTLRIILNISIKRSFFRILANSKTNLRFTDSQNVWAASGSNAHQLKDLLEERLNEQKEQDNKERLSEEENDIKKLKKKDLIEEKDISTNQCTTEETQKNHDKEEIQNEQHCKEKESIEEQKDEDKEVPEGENVSKKQKKEFDESTEKVEEKEEKVEEKTEEVKEKTKEVDESTNNKEESTEVDEQNRKADDV